MNKNVIYSLGIKYRNPTLNSQLDKLQFSDRLEYDKLRELQLKKLKILLTFARNHSPYYTRLFKKLNLDPTTIKSIEILKHIPIIDKETLIKNQQDIQSRANIKRLQFSETSGTTGKSLGIYRSEEWDSGTRAAMFRGLSWYNVKPWEKNGYLWGYNMSPKDRLKTRVLDTLQNRFRLFSYTNKEITNFCKRLKYATYLSGYSSMIYEVAKKVNEMGLSGQYPKLKMIKGTSEKIYPSYQKEIKKAFGLKMISEYGSMESGIIAFECPEGNMHIAMENVILEEVDGEAIVTNLLSNSFPIIRYRLGDAIKLAPLDYKCPCGRDHPILLDILGRTGKLIYGKNETYPSLTFYYIFKNIALKKSITLNYQAEQVKKGEILIRIEQDFSEKIDFAIKNEMEKYFKNDLTYKIRYRENLHSQKEKMKDFIQHL